MVALKDTERFWDEKALRSGGDYLRAVCLDTPEENRCIDRVQQALARGAMKWLSRREALTNRLVLDYGCGTGRWVGLFREYGCRYAGVDVSAGMLAIAKGRYPDAEFRKSDGLRIPCGDDSVDVIWTVAVVHHNPPERQERLMAEFARVLRNRGTLALLEGVEPRPRGEADIYYPRTRESWTALARRYGLARRWSRGGSYFLLRSLGEYLRREHGLINAPVVTPASESTAGPEARPGWLRWAARVDSVLCPYLVGVLPGCLHRRAIMLFEKSVRPAQPRYFFALS